MTVLSLAIYDPATPNGTPLVTLTDADLSECEIRGAENELGAIKFTIRRDHPSATPANLAGGNYVKVTVPAWDANPVLGFWLNHSADTLVAQNEEGGEFLTRTGFGTLAILGNAALLDQFYNGPLGGLNRGNYNVPGYWTWETEPYGAILVRLIEEGQLQPGLPLGDVTIDFVRTLDSNGNAWPDVEELLQFPIGTDGLTVYQRLIEAGFLYVYADPDLSIHAYGTSQGVDRSSLTFGAGKVRLEKGVNIATEVVRNGTSVVTHALVIGKDHTYRQVVAPGYSGPPGRWIEVDYPESNDPTHLDNVGAHALAHSALLEESFELEIDPGDDEANGRYLPFLHFRPGDLVTVHTGTGSSDYNEATVPLVGFRAVLGDVSKDDTADEAARSWHIVVELNRNRTTDRIGAPGGGHGMGDCPFFVDAGSNALGRSMRLRDTGDGLYTQIHAGNETADREAWMEVNVTTDAYVYFFASNTDGAASDYSEITLGGEGTLEVKGGERIEFSVGNDDTFKFHFFGGAGIVLPSLSSDPATAGEEGQVYWNTTSHNARAHDGTSWVDLGTGTGGAGLDYLADDDATLATPGVRFAGSFGGDDATYIGAKGGTTGQDAVLDMRAEVGNVNFDVFANEGSESVDIFGDGTAGALDITVSDRIGIAVSGTASTSKHVMTGGHGLVVPLLAADPSGGNSEQGQIYFNTISGTFRGYDGTAWGELALT